jgi:TonB family protein
MKAFLFLAFLFAPAAVFSADAEPSSIEITFQWKLSLDPAGKITGFVPINKNYQAAVREQLEPVVRRWNFTPGKLDGQPAATETTLRVRVSLDPTSDDSYRVRIVSADTGVDYRHVLAPKYPEWAKRMGHQGGVLVRIDYDARGRITSAVPAAKGEGAAQVDASLTNAAVAAVKKWTMRPETVAGHGVAGTAIAPICFSLLDRYEQCQWNLPGEKHPIDPARPIALTSVVGLDMGTADHMP